MSGYDSSCLSVKGILAVFAVILVAAISWRSGFHSGMKQQTAVPSGEHRLLFYRNPMNPAVTSPTPAKDEMGMDYIPVYADDAQFPAKSAEQQADDFFSDETAVPGRGVVTLSDQGLRLSGVQVAEAVMATVERTVRTVGQVIPDETRIHRVQIKVGGWVEQLFINFSGQYVQKGVPIFSLYSPELVSSQEELVMARQVALKHGQDTDDDGRTTGRQLQDAALRRLELFDVPKDVIRSVEKTGRPLHSVTLLSPADGYVMSKDIFQGQEVKPGMELYTVTDLSVVWVDAQIYEDEVKDVHPGQEGILTSSFDPALRLTGKISYVYPYLNRDSRTLNVRFLFENNGLRLKPGMYVDITLVYSSAGDSLVIPDSAVMDSGARQMVFVDKGQGHFEPRVVTVGVKSGGKIQVLSGLNVHDHIAVKANFLLDSESRLRALVDAAMVNKTP